MTASAAASGTQYQKTFECLTCQAPIKLERDQTNNKWLRYNLDGSEHKCVKRKQQQQPPSSTATDSNSTEALLRLILLEQRTNFEKVDYALTKLNNTLDALSSVIASIHDELQKQHQHQQQQQQQSSIRSRPDGAIRG